MKKDNSISGPSDQVLCRRKYLTHIRNRKYEGFDLIKEELSLGETFSSVFYGTKFFR
jgi:hypothetical protein